MKLNKTERDFVWNLVTLEDRKCCANLKKIKNKENLIKYLIKSRVDSFFYSFVKKNGLLHLLSNSELQLLIKTSSFKNFRYILTLQSAINISKKLKENNIPHVFLKGIALSNLISFYNHPLRDIDILIPHEFIDESIDKIRSLNFKSAENQSDIKNVVTNDPFIYDLPQLKNEQDIFLEIHYKIVTGHSEKKCKFSRDLINNRLLKNIFNEELNVPSNEFLLLHYIYHGTRKGSFDVGASAILNIFLILRYLEIDYTLLKTIAFRNAMDYEYNFLKKLTNFNKESELFQNDLKELFINQPIHSKIGFLISNSNIRLKLEFLIKSIFPPISYLRKEFNISDFRFYHYLYIIPRWRRQFALLIKEHSFLHKNKINLHKRKKLINRINTSLKQKNLRL